MKNELKELNVFFYKKWIPIKEIFNNNLIEINNKGVYIIAKFKNKKELPSVSLLDENIIYIGETTGQTLRGRLKQFISSVKKGILEKNGKGNKYLASHSGGYSYLLKYGNNIEDLYFTFIYSEKKEKDSFEKFETKVKIKYIEKKLILDIVKKYNKKIKLLNKE